MEARVAVPAAVMGIILLVVLVTSLDFGPMWWLGLAAAILCGWGMLALVSSSRQKGSAKASSRFEDLHLAGPGAQQLLAFERRLREDEHYLAERLPEDPLENSAMVELFSSLRHDSSGGRQALEDEYQSYRQRFLEWQRTVRTIPVNPVVTSEGAVVPPIKWGEQKVAEAAAIREFVDGLEKRADDLQRTLEEAVAEVAHAAEALANARASHDDARAFSNAPDRTSDLDAAGEKLEQARRELRSGSENPKLAFSLARQVLEITAKVTAEAAETRELPMVARERLEAYQSRRAEVEAEIKRIHTDFSLVAKHHAPSSWADVSGAGAAAERALARADQSYQSAIAHEHENRSSNAFLDAIKHLDEALASLDDALGQARKIADRIAVVEEAASSSREKLNKAEVAVDQAWARSGGASASTPETREALDRATQLIEQARAEMSKPQPDWLMVSSLADRAQALTELKVDDTSRVDAHATVLYQLLSVERERAKVTRDRAWAISMGSDSVRADTMLSTLLDGLESTYQSALKLEAEAVSESETVGNAEAADAAIQAFRNVNEMATDFASQAEKHLTPKSRRLFRTARDEAEMAEFVVWGVASITAALIERE